MTRALIVLTGFIFCIIGNALSQNLQIPINQAHFIRDSALVKRVPNFIDPSASFIRSGYFETEFVNDFSLLTQNDSLISLQAILQDGKPLVLVSGNFSCHAFRYNVPEINRLKERYKDSIHVVVVLCQEAHPAFEPSPYYGYINNSVQNERDGVRVHQVKYYIERKYMADSVMARTGLQCTMLLDDENNSWIQRFGPAPNNAYLIGPGGSVVDKHGWFNRAPDDMFATIDSLLGRPHNKILTGGKLQFEKSYETKMKGLTGYKMQLSVRVDNFSMKSAEIGIRKKQQHLPANWSSSFCTNVCYDTSADYITYFLKPGESGYIALDVNTDLLLPDSASFELDIVNLSDSANRINPVFHVHTYISLQAMQKSASAELHVYPSTQKGIVFIETNQLKEYALTIFSRRGDKVFTFTKGRIPSVLNLAFLEPGLYTMEFEREGAITSRRYIRQ